VGTSVSKRNEAATIPLPEPQEEGTLTDVTGRKFAASAGGLGAAPTPIAAPAVAQSSPEMQSPPEIK